MAWNVTVPQASRAAASPLVFDGATYPMAEVTDYYQTLEVDENATPDAIKKAYRKLARAYHPDRNPGDPAAEERFKGVQEAYETLSDPARRRAYDRERRYGPSRGRRGDGGNPFGAGGPFGGFEARGARGAAGFHTEGARTEGFSGADGFDPLFSFFFSDDARTTAPPSDVETELKLTFDQALRGGRTEVRLPDGETVRLAIPRGVRSGLKVRVRGHGETGATGDRGDLYVTFRVAPSPRFRREGDNLHLAETVSAVEAMLGTTRQITNAYGQTVKVHIPAGTQPGERLRLRGQGVATEQKTGDLFVEIQVVVPRELTDAQREALETTAREIGLL